MLRVCWYDVCSPVRCLVGMLPAALKGLVDLLPHTVVLINTFMGLRHHLGGVSLRCCVAPIRLLLLHSVGGLGVVQGGRLGHDHVGRTLLQHAVKAAGQRHAHSLLGGVGVQVHLLLKESHALVLLLLLLQLLLGVLLRKLLGVLGMLLGVLLDPLRVPALALGCDYLVPLVLTGGDCWHMLLLVGGGQILLVGGVPLYHPPLLLVHLHSLLRLEVGHGHGALLSSHFVHVVLWVRVHASRRGRGMVLLGRVAGR